MSKQRRFEMPLRPAPPHPTALESTDAVATALATAFPDTPSCLERTWTRDACVLTVSWEDGPARSDVEQVVRPWVRPRLLGDAYGFLVNVVGSETPRIC
jgi:hypothetical protein